MSKALTLIDLHCLALAVAGASNKIMAWKRILDACDGVGICNLPDDYQALLLDVLNDLPDGEAAR